MANIVELKDSTSTKCYPLTKAQAVYFDDGYLVKDKITINSGLINNALTYASLSFDANISLSTTGGIFSSEYHYATRNFYFAKKGSAIYPLGGVNVLVAKYSSASADSFVSCVICKTGTPVIIDSDIYIRVDLSYDNGSKADGSIVGKSTYLIVSDNLSESFNTFKDDTEEEIRDINTFSDIDFVVGALSAAYAEPVEMSNRARTDYIFVRTGSKIVCSNSNYQFSVFEFGSNATMYYTLNQQSMTWSDGSYEITHSEVACIRIVVKKINDSDISSDDLAVLKESFFIYPVEVTTPPISIEEIPTAIFNTATVAFDSNTDMSYNDIISGYDALVTEFPYYVTKVELGTDSSGTYKIYQYVFTPKQSPKLTYNYGGKTYNEDADHMPTIVLEAGVHGGERPIVKGLLNAMTKICKNWQTDDVLAFLRFNFRFVVNPCATPYGYATNSRFNANGVNINRNFNGMDSWQYGSSEVGDENYRGTAPLSEVESQYIYNTLNNYKKSCILYYSYHTYGMAQTYTEMMCWSWGTYIKPNEMWIAGENVLKQISRNAWSKHSYPYNEGKLIGTMQAENGIRTTAAYRGGYTSNQGNAFGIPSACPEGIYHVFGDTSTKNSHGINCLNTEFVIITILEGLKQLYK